MSDVWVLLLAGGSLVLVGFAAAQVFDRFRIPDYFVLMSIGVVLGSGWIPLGGIDPRASLVPVAPVLTSIALAFILFEGGLVLRVRGMGRVWAAATGHTAAAMALSIVGVWLTGMYVLGFASTTSLILAIAFCGPSATIVLSFLPRMNVADRTRFTLTVEGVLGNVVATVLVLLLVQLPGSPADAGTWMPYLANAAAAVALAAIAGFAWAKAVNGNRRPAFAFMTSVALAALLYGVGEGFLGGNGGIAAFVFGLVLGSRHVLAAPHPEVPGARGLTDFHRELVFLLRTFFFVYLGLQVKLPQVGVAALLGAVAFTGVFLASRLPSSVALGRMWRLPKLDVGILRATVGRGLTDTVLILFAIESGVIPPSEAGLVTDLLFLVVLAAAAVSALLVAVAERVPKPDPGEATPPPDASTVAGPGSFPSEFDRALAEFLEDPLLRRGEVG
jgi:potassium/hydrogen antiporter